MAALRVGLGAVSRVMGEGRRRAARAMGTYRGHDGMTNYSLIDPPTKPTPSVDPDEAFLGSNLIMKWIEGVRRYGWQRTIVQAYTIGDIKFGKCVGEDVNGNQYFENNNYPHGQHRWVEFKDIHNLDASSVPPEWHGWMTSMQDAPGPDAGGYIDTKMDDALQIDGAEHAIYANHLGRVCSEASEGMLNKTGFRKRGYKIGGHMMQPEDGDQYHVHSGHAVNKDSRGRYDDTKGVHLWDPSEEGEPKLQPTRSLDVN